MKAWPEERFAAQQARFTESGRALLNRALHFGGDYADLFYEHTVHHRLVLCQEASQSAVGRPRVEQDRHVHEGVGFRTLRDARGGFAWTDRLVREAVEAAAAEAGAHVGPALGIEASPLREAQQAAPLPPDAPGRVAASEKAALVQEAADAALSLGADVRRVVVHYQDRTRRTFVATTEGASVSAAAALLGLRVEVVLAGQKGSVKAHAVAGGAYGFGSLWGQTPAAVARQAVARARVLAAARPLAPGVMPVVIAGGWGGVWLHEAVGHLLEADTVEAGASAYAARPGRRVASAAVTLVDDPTLPGGRGSMPFDDEGTAAERTVLVEAGWVRNVLTDRRHARRLGLSLTGHARRQDFRHPPLPRMTNLVLLPGEAVAADLIAGVGAGLYVKTIGQGVVRPREDVYAFDVVEGHRIEQGRLTVPVTGMRIEGRCTEALRQIGGIARDGQLDTARGLCAKAGQVVPVSMSMPTVLVRDLAVAPAFT